MLNFEDLYQNFSGDVYYFSLWMTGDHQEAQDITSETFVRAWARKGTIRTETLKAYLFTIARNINLKKQRREKRQKAFTGLFQDPNPGPEQITETQDRISSVGKYLLTIPEIDRAAFILRVQHELPYAEIARMLGLSLASAKVKVHRVRKKILVAFLEKEVPK
jgi:RNA polymerase sigma-70 factor (ECF subfamily)